MRTAAETESTKVSRRKLRLGPFVCALLFFATILTTTSTGALYAWNFSHGVPLLSGAGDLIPLEWIVRHPGELLSGLPFSLALLGILLAHEFGHWWFCVRHRIQTSWPYLIPAPTLSGTAGAVIRIRSRIPDRNALMEVGVAGPVAGFFVTLPVMLAGILLSKPLPAGSPAGLIQLNPPLAMSLPLMALRMADPAIPPLDGLLWHPILLAAWIGLFITALNLVPAGQLDGGHLLYACTRRAHRWITRVIGVLLLAAGVKLWAGWLLWGLILLLPQMRHPYVPPFPDLQKKNKLLAAAGALIFLLTFLPTPMPGMSLLEYLR